MSTVTCNENEDLTKKGLRNDAIVALASENEVRTKYRHRNYVNYGKAHRTTIARVAETFWGIVSQRKLCVRSSNGGLRRLRGMLHIPLLSGGAIVSDPI